MVLTNPTPTCWLTSRNTPLASSNGAQPKSGEIRTLNGRIGARLLDNLASQPTAIRSERTAWQRCNAIAMH